MRILVVGASGTLGRAVVAELGERHEIVRAGRHGADVRLDLERPEGLAGAFEAAGALDAVVCAAGSVKFAPLASLARADFELGLRSKLMGQVELALAASRHLSEGGSITLTSGVLAQDPIRGGASASLVNGALESFVLAAAIELPRGLRINAVSPGLLAESAAAYGASFPGFELVPAARAARAFAKSVEGARSGQVFRVL